jgi:hypothetical protein
MLWQLDRSRLLGPGPRCGSQQSLHWQRASWRLAVLLLLCPGGRPAAVHRAGGCRRPERRLRPLCGIQPHPYAAQLGLCERDQGQLQQPADPEHPLRRHLLRGRLRLLPVHIHLRAAGRLWQLSQQLHHARLVRPRRHAGLLLRGGLQRHLLRAAARPAAAKLPRHGLCQSRRMEPLLLPPEHRQPGHRHGDAEHHAGRLRRLHQGQRPPQPLRL